MKRPQIPVIVLVLSAAFAAGQQSTQAGSPSKAVPAQTTQASAPEPTAPLTSDEIKALIEKASDNDLENDKIQRDYTYKQREEERELHGQGEVKSTHSTTSEVLMLFGSEVDRVIAKDDKPLSPKDAAKEDKRIQKIIDEREHESEGEREKRLKKEEKDREESREWVREIKDAYNFTPAGIENVDGREAYIIDSTPRPGFQPHLKYANYLSKFRFRAWIDKQDVQLSKLDAECIDTVSWGLFLVRLHKGTHFVFAQTRINNEVWLPKHMAVHLDARVALLKHFNVEDETSFSDYQKFRTDTKILGMAPVKPER